MRQNDPMSRYHLDGGASDNLMSGASRRGIHQNGSNVACRFAGLNHPLRVLRFHSLCGCNTLRIKRVLTKNLDR